MPAERLSMRQICEVLRLCWGEPAAAAGGSPQPRPRPEGTVSGYLSRRAAQPSKSVGVLFRENRHFDCLAPTRSQLGELHEGHL